jgi:hypothetical protein
MKLLVSCAVLVTLLAVPLSASAQEEKGLLGIGLIVGEPSGVSAKYYLSNDRAIDGAIGAGLIDTGFHAHVDYLFHPWILESQDSFVMPLYLGPGFRFLVADSGRGADAVYHTGLRAAIGILFDFRNVPIDVFVEAAPILEWKFSSNDDDSGFGININAAAGVRYYF